MEFPALKVKTEIEMLYSDIAIQQNILQRMTSDSAKLDILTCILEKQRKLIELLSKTN